MTGPAPTAVVFDMDGTLLDTMTSIPAAYAATFRARGGPAVRPADVAAAWHLGPTPVVLAHFLGRPAGAEDVECYHRQVERAVAHVRAFTGVPAMLDVLDRAGCRLGVFTSATRRATTLLLAATGLDRFFPIVVCGDEVDEPKPAPDGLLLACRELGVEVTATAYVGDAEVDLRCAEAAGATAVHAGWSGSAATVPGDWPVADRPDEIAELLGLTRAPSPGPCCRWIRLSTDLAG